jgi:hypothetical protein
MKSNTLITLSLGFLFALVCGNVSAQSTKKAGETNLTAGPQAVTNTAVTNPDVLVLTGKIVDATTQKPVTNAKINFDKFGDEVLQASIDDKGNYALALNKKEMGEPVRVIFKVNGFKKYVVKNLDRDATYVDADIFLQPMDTEAKSDAKITYKMDDNPFNPLVIRLQ